MEDEIAELANRTFILYKLTAIYKLNSFKEIEANLSDYLCQNLSLRKLNKKPNKKIEYNGELIDIRIDPVYFKDLSIYDNSIQPIKISIEILTFKDNKNTVHYMFFLPSSFLPNQQKDFTFYPLVLIKANQRIRNLITDWFKKEYAAHLSPLFLPPLYMKNMLNIWIESIYNLPNQDSFELVPDEMLDTPLRLEYTTDDVNLNSIEIALNQDQVKEICSKLNDHNQFLDVFHLHVLNTTKVNLNTLTFNKISSSLGSFKRDGHIKISGHAHKVYAIKLLQAWIDFAAERVYE